MGNFKKFFYGSIKSEQDAAALYDKLAILLHGISARTNFQYTKTEILVMLDNEAEFKRVFEMATTI